MMEMERLEQVPFGSSPLYKACGGSHMIPSSTLLRGDRVFLMIKEKLSLTLDLQTSM